jgi:hypothetical protein
MFGGIFAIAGLLPSLFTGKTSLTCDRLPDSSGTCEILQSTLWQTRRQTFPLEDLQGTEVVSNPSSEGNTTYQVVLLLPEKSIPLSDFSSSDDRTHHQEQADRINQFVQDPTQSNLAIAEDLFGLMVIPSILFSGSGLLVIACFGQIIILEFDKLSNQFILIRRGLLGSKRIEHPLRNIARSYVERGSRNTYLIKLMLTSGETFAVTPYSSSGYDEKFRVTQEIQSFLGVEPTVTTDPRSLLPQPGDLLGLMLGGNQKRQQRVEEYQARISRQPEDIEAHLGIASVLALQGKQREAKEHLEKFRSQFAAEGKYDLAQLLDQAIASMNS